MFLLINILHLPFEFLYLNYSNPKWFQFITCLFCHASYAHLSGNLFLLYVFGRLIEEEEKITGIMVSYFVCGIGAGAIDYILSDKSGAALGASGAVFGLFVVAMLIKFKMKFTNILDLLIIVPFVFMHVTHEVSKLGANDRIGHDVHLYGALIGGLLILGLHFLKKRMK